MLTLEDAFDFSEELGTLLRCDVRAPVGTPA
jgi:hypothetical protein